MKNNNVTTEEDFKNENSNHRTRVSPSLQILILIPSSVYETSVGNIDVYTKTNPPELQEKFSTWTKNSKPHFSQNSSPGNRATDLESGMGID